MRTSEIEQLALIMASDIRKAAVHELGVGKDLDQIHRMTKAELERVISRQSLAWHLQKLLEGGVIKETSGRWSLTSSGWKVFETLKKIDEEC